MLVKQFSYIKEVDKKNSVYYLYTHEEQPAANQERKQALHKTKQNLLAQHHRQPRNVKIVLDLAQVCVFCWENMMIVCDSVGKH